MPHYQRVEDDRRGVRPIQAPAPRVRVPIEVLDARLSLDLLLHPCPQLRSPPRTLARTMRHPHHRILV